MIFELISNRREIEIFNTFDQRDDHISDKNSLVEGTKPPLSEMDILYRWIPGYTRWVTYFWQYLSAEECKHITLISRGPELPLTTILTLFVLCKYVIPYMIRRRGRAYDTRPLGMHFFSFCWRF